MDVFCLSDGVRPAALELILKNDAKFSFFQLLLNVFGKSLQTTVSIGLEIDYVHVVILLPRTTD